MPKLTHPQGGTVYATVAGAAVLRSRGYTDPEYAEPLDVDGPERPADTDRRGDWDAYARSIGVDPGAFSSKPALIAAIDSGEAG